jgi:hypothetical protein
MPIMQSAVRNARHAANRPLVARPRHRVRGGPLLGSYPVFLLVRLRLASSLADELALTHEDSLVSFLLPYAGMLAPGAALIVAGEFLRNVRVATAVAVATAVVASTACAGIATPVMRKIRSRAPAMVANVVVVILAVSIYAFSLWIMDAMLRNPVPSGALPAVQNAAWIHVGTVARLLPLVPIVLLLAARSSRRARSH